MFSNCNSTSNWKIPLSNSQLLLQIKLINHHWLSSVLLWNRSVVSTCCKQCLHFQWQIAGWQTNKKSFKSYVIIRITEVGNNVCTHLCRPSSLLGWTPATVYLSASATNFYRGCRWYRMPPLVSSQEPGDSSMTPVLRNLHWLPIRHRIMGAIW